MAAVKVGGGVFAGEILAGYALGGSLSNPDVQIGMVKVGNNFIGSSISAGVSRGTKWFGDSSDAIATPAAWFTDGALRSRIARVMVDGYIPGNPFHTMDFTTGIVAQDIGTVSVNGIALELTPTTPANPDLFVPGVRHDFFVREVA